MQAPYIQIVDSSETEDIVFEHVKHIVSEILIAFSKEINDQPDLFAIELNDKESIYFKN